MVNSKISLPPPLLSRPKRARVGEHATPYDATIEAQLKVPNERDRSVNMTSSMPDPVILQAAADVERGLQDTSKGVELQYDDAIEAQLKMPNERDGSVNMTASMPDPVILQAAADVERGLQDTSKGVELHLVYKKLK